MAGTKTRPGWSLIALFLCVGASAFYLYRHSQTGSEVRENLLTKDALSIALTPSLNGSLERFPNEIQINVSGKSERVIVQYAFDPGLQEAMENQFRHYKPDFGAFVAMDASTGRVLSMVSYAHKANLEGNLTLRATFPSASVFKVVTAAAAIEEKKYSAQTIIPFLGSNHTLYRKNILNSKPNRWMRYMTLKEAFARSVNPVFGRIGAYTVSAKELRSYADRFGFNRKIASDVPMQEGQAPITNDAWSLAESASGFTRANTMSPLQGALIAAAVANDGVMMEPYIVESVHSEDGTEVYAAQPRVVGTSVDAATAAEIRALMKETVARGTSRASFRRFFKGEFSGLEVGGKTGSLTGEDPPGKYDWFVGFAGNGAHRIAFAALTVHQKFWTVKSSYLARLAIENYFKGRLTKSKQDLLDAPRATSTW